MKACTFRRGAGALALCALLAAAPAFAAKKENGPAAPPLPKGAVFKLSYATVAGRVENGGIGFAVRLEGHETPALLTSPRLMGPPDGLKRWVTAGEFPWLVTGMQAADAFGGRPVPMEAEPLPPECGGAYALKQGNGVSPFPLSSRRPEPGETLWLAAPARQASRKSARLHAARVLKLEEENIFVVFDDTKLLLVGAEGAPVLDSAGKVLGVFSGGLGLREGRPAGKTLAASSFYGELSSSLADWERDHASRAFEIRAEIPASVSEVWRAWATSEGIQSFFAPKAEIGARPGGPYRVLLAPEAPEGSRGCDSCEIVQMVQERRLVTTWLAPPPCAGARKTPLRMTILLEPMHSEDILKGRTFLKLRLSGFGEGPDWDCAYGYLHAAFEGVVLKRLTERFETGKPFDWEAHFKQRE